MKSVITLKPVSFFLAIILGVGICISASVSSVFANDFPEQVSESEAQAAYESNPLPIFPGRDRISSNGSFEFEISLGVQSSNFKLSSTNTTITCWSTPPISAQGKDFEIELYEKSGIIWNGLGVKTYKTGYDEKKWTGLSTSKSYHFIISVGRNYPGYLAGNGSVSNYVAP
jgi:hypothetical protein